MKQAIDEGFILDVLKHYLSYSTYFKLVQKVTEDKEYDEKKAKKILRSFVEKHPHAIAQKQILCLNILLVLQITKSTIKDEQWL